MRISDGSSDVCSSDLESVIQSRDTYKYNWVWVDDFQRPGPYANRYSNLTNEVSGLPLYDENNKPRQVIHDFAATLSGSSTYRRSEEHTSELQSLMRISYAVFCLQKQK